MIRKQALYLVSAKAIVFDGPEIPTDACYVLRSSDHKVSIGVIIMDTVAKSVRYSAPLKPALVITVHVSVSNTCFFPHLNIEKQT